MPKQKIKEIMTNKQAEIANNRIQVLEDRIQKFNLIINIYLKDKESSLYINLVTTMTEFQLEVHSLRESLNTRHEWLFNFVGGGWNQVMAYTLEDAIETAHQEYSGMDIQDGSFRISTPGDYKTQMSSFY